MSEGKSIEPWHDIPGYPGYQVSDHGRVVSFWRRLNHVWILVPGRPKFLKPSRTANGYLMIRLKKRQRSLHLLVLESFVGARPPGMEGRHLDDNKENNHLCNLEWGSHSQNMQERTLHGRDGVSSLTTSDVHEIRRLLALGMTQSDVAIRFHLTQPAVSRLNTGKTWGYI